MATSGRQWSQPALDALDIWRAGVQAVDSATLVIRQIETWKNGLSLAGSVWRARPDSRICVVGAGKAGAGMAAGVEQALGDHWLKRTTGWVNVPEDCVRSLKTISLHPARPAGVNEPTQAGVQGTTEILRLVSSLGENDLCLVLISGGGSALLPLPVSGVTLEEKLQVTRALMRNGATISELNCVRRAISQVKGGGLLRACRAGLMVTLIISDVIGDPLETIASGPTIDTPPDPAQALEIVRRFSRLPGVTIPDSVFQRLQEEAARQTTLPDSVSGRSVVRNESVVIGNNQTAVQSAARQARRLGYDVLSATWDQPGDAATWGREWADQLLDLKPSAGTSRGACLISGGEPTVRLARTDGPQKGGRNQELVLAAAVRCLEQPSWPAFALISGGTDGEDGPTDAAGAMIDAPLLSEIRTGGRSPEDFLKVNNSYPFFDHFHALVKTGPTDTNVMDLRVGLVAAAQT